jgi:serine/threonine protein kinase
MSMRRCAAGQAHPTIAGRVAGGPAAKPAGRLVARRYRLRALLGRGGMARVWLADDVMLRRPVALKQILVNSLVSEELRTAAWACALREARTAACVDHVGAVTIHDLVEENRCPWIVMEPLSGRTLRETLDAVGPLPVEEATRVGLGLLEVLAATHRAGIVHLDVKPGNVQLCTGGRVVLIDFGIACMIDDAAAATDTFAGSPAYIAPERLGGGAAGPASDLFSLGATLFAAVEGRPPFDGDTPRATFTAIVDDARAPFRRAGTLRPVIEGLLAKDPDRRLNIDQTRALLRGTPTHHAQHCSPAVVRAITANPWKGAASDAGSPKSASIAAGS